VHEAKIAHHTRRRPNIERIARIHQHHAQTVEFSSSTQDAYSTAARRKELAGKKHVNFGASRVVPAKGAAAFLTLLIDANFRRKYPRRARNEWTFYMAPGTP
jgi:hypothetical protein